MNSRSMTTSVGNYIKISKSIYLVIPAMRIQYKLVKLIAVRDIDIWTVLTFDNSNQYQRSEINIWSSKGLRDFTREVFVHNTCQVFGWDSISHVKGYIDTQVSSKHEGIKYRWLCNYHVNMFVCRVYVNM